MKCVLCRSLTHVDSRTAQPLQVMWVAIVVGHARALQTSTLSSRSQLMSKSEFPLSVRRFRTCGPTHPVFGLTSNERVYQVSSFVRAEGKSDSSDGGLGSTSLRGSGMDALRQSCNPAKVSCQTRNSQSPG
jgi:hypothetical protein